MCGTFRENKYKIYKNLDLKKMKIETFHVKMKCIQYSFSKLSLFSEQEGDILLHTIYLNEFLCDSIEY